MIYLSTADIFFFTFLLCLSDREAIPGVFLCVLGILKFFQVPVFIEFQGHSRSLGGSRVPGAVSEAFQGFQMVFGSFQGNSKEFQGLFREFQLVSVVFMRFQMCSKAF